MDSQEKKLKNIVACIICSMFAVGFTYIFTTWVMEQRKKFTFSVGLSAISFIMFTGVFLYVVKRITDDFFIRSAEPPKIKPKKSIKPALIIMASLLVWDAVIVILVGLGYKYVHSSTLSLAQNIEAIFRKLDSNQYIWLSEHWYTNTGELGTDVSIVFLPGYPILVKLFSLPTRQYFWTSMALSAIFFSISGVFLYKLVQKDNTKSGAITALIYYAILPGVFFFAAPMTESLFLCLTFGAVYCIREKKWFAAALLGGYASFTRSAGVFLVIIYGYELFMEVWHNNRTKKGFGYFVINAIKGLLIPLGLFGYLLINKIVTGEWTKFMYFQKNHWGQSLGYFFSTVNYMWNYLVQYFRSGDTDKAIGLWVMGLFAIFTLLLLFFRNMHKIRPSYMLYSLAYFAFSMGATWLLSAPRYAIGLFTLPIMLSLGSEHSGKISYFRLVLSSLVILVISIGYGAMFVLRWQIW